MKTLLKTSILLATLTMILSACSIFLDKEREEGAPCKSAEDCNGDLHCVMIEGGNEPWFKCAPIGGINEPCYRDLYCVEGADCIDGKCQDADLCTPSCSENYTCRDLDPDGPTCVYGADGTSSQECHEGMCVWGLECGMDNICTEKTDLCDPICNEMQDCVNLEIMGWTCVGLDQARESGTCYQSMYCEVGLDCVSNTCVSDQPLDCEPACVAPTPKCLNLNTSGFTCVGLKDGDIGQPCFFGECYVDLFCVDGSCESDACIPCESSDACEQIDEGQWACLPPGEGHLDQACYDLDGDFVCAYDPNESESPTCLQVTAEEYFCVPSGEGFPGDICTSELGLCEIGSHCTLPYLDDDFALQPYCIRDGEGDEAGDLCILTNLMFDICDAGYSCQDGSCQPYGGEGSYCDIETNCDDPSDDTLRCLDMSGSSFCIPEHIGDWAQPCWHNECKTGLQCMPLEGGTFICADDGSGLFPDQDCFLGRCAVGLSCQGDTCAENGGGQDDSFCAFEIQCQADLFCDFATGRCTSDEPENPHGSACDPSSPECATAGDICHKFWGDLPAQDMTGRCTPPCKEQADCSSWGGCLFDAESQFEAEFNGRVPNGYCGFHEWTNHYGIDCTGGTPVDNAEHYVCATSTLDNADQTETATYRFFTTECSEACPPEWDCCELEAPAIGRYCAPPLMCGFMKYCPNGLADCTSDLYNICVNFSAFGHRCSKGCAGDGDPNCPSGAVCKYTPDQDTFICTYETE